MPCGMEKFNCFADEYQFLILTLQDLGLRLEFTRSMALSLIPKLQCNVFKRMSWSTVLKAALKSIVTITVTSLFSMAHSESFTNLSIAVSHL